MKISRELLHKKIKKILIYHNVSESDAEITTNAFIEGTVRNYPHHGIDRIFQMLEGIKNKTINPCAIPSQLVDLPAIAVINAHNGIGQAIGHKAMELAIDKAKKVGVGVVGVINSSHLGILAYYSELASQNNCIGLVMSTSSPAVVIKGGNIKTFGTNPISYSFPHNLYPVTADFATSKVSRGTICDYAKKEMSVPIGWGVDKNGQDTTDPRQILDGGIKTIDGDIKGSLLSMFVSVMAGNLIGGVSNHKVTGTRYMDQMPNKGDLFMAFSIEHFTTKDSFSNSINELMQFISEQNAEFKVPGKNDHLYKEQIINEIPISDDLKRLFDDYN